MAILETLKNLFNPQGKLPSSEELLRRSRRPQYGGYVPPMPGEESDARPLSGTSSYPGTPPIIQDSSHPYYRNVPYLGDVSAQVPPVPPPPSVDEERSQKKSASPLTVFQNMLTPPPPAEIAPLEDKPSTSLINVPPTSAQAPKIAQIPGVDMDTNVGMGAGVAPSADTSQQLTPPAADSAAAPAGATSDSATPATTVGTGVPPPPAETADIRNYDGRRVMQSGGRVVDADTGELIGGDAQQVFDTLPPATPLPTYNAEAVGTSLLRTGLPGAIPPAQLPPVPAPAPGMGDGRVRAGAALTPQDVRAGATPQTAFVQPGAPGEPTRTFGQTRAQQMERVAPKVAKLFPSLGKPTPVVTPDQAPSTAITYRPFEKLPTPPPEKQLTYQNQPVQVGNLNNQEVLLDQYGNTIAPLSEFAQSTINGQRVIVIGNDVVRPDGTKVMPLATALQDRNFAYEHRMHGINKQMADAAIRGDEAELARLDRERAQEKVTWLRNRPKDTTRSWGEVLKGIGIGALQGYATGGLGGAIGGALTGGALTAINPEWGQQLMDKLYRLPRAESEVEAARGREKAQLDAEKGRLEVLKGDQATRNEVLEGRKRLLQSNPTWLRFMEGATLNPDEIVTMERELGFATGIRPFESIKNQFEFVNGELIAKAPDGTWRMAVDRYGNPLFDLRRTLVRVINPNGGAVHFITSEDEAKRLGNWAVTQFVQGAQTRRTEIAQEGATERTRLRGETQKEVAAIRGARAKEEADRGTLTPEQKRSTEDRIETIKGNLSLIPERRAALEAEIADRKAFQQNLVNPPLATGGRRYSKDKTYEQLRGPDKKAYDEAKETIRKAESKLRILKIEEDNLKAELERLGARLAPNRSTEKESTTANK